MVWVEGAGPHDVYFKRSTNGGASFGSTINLSNDDNGSAHPDIAVDGDNVYVVWVSTIAEDQEQLFFKRSTNDGASFGSVKKLDIQFEELNPRIAAAGNNVYIAFIGGHTDHEEVFFTKSTNQGSSFSKVISINNNDDFSFFGDIAAKGNNVYITWRDSSLDPSFTTSHVFFKRSTDNGKSFGSIKDFGPGARPQLDTISNNVYIVWGNGDGNIAFKASNE